MNFNNKNIIKYGAIGILSAFFGIWLLTYIARPIQTIHSFSVVNFNSIGTDTLVVFDVDETLIQPTDTYSINEHTPQGEKFRKKLLLKHPEIKNWDIYADISLREVQRPLVEPMIIQKISQLQARGVRVIACTFMNTGKYGPLEKMEAWRYEHLKSLGFQGSFSDLIIDVPLTNRKPVFYKGVLATDTLLKGPVIMAFLDAIQYVPKKIIMFDDSIEYLESTLAECKKRNITFQGYLYTRAIAKPWDEELIEFQAEYLIQHKKWLTDDEARALMDQQKQFAYAK